MMNNSILLNNSEYKLPNIKSESVFDYVVAFGDGYLATENLAYYSRRYKKYITVEAGEYSDGATSAPDIDSWCWIFHDEACREGKFNGGAAMNNWQASNILSDILKEEGRWLRARTWHYSTWLIGGGKARDNGLI